MLLRESGNGNPEIAEQIFTIAYVELRRLAGSMLRSQREGHTLQATALVHEAYIKLLSGEQPSFESRSHFFGVAATVMRQILVDHARKHLSQKRGAGAQKFVLHEEMACSTQNACEILELHEALEALEQFDARKARVVEMRFFAGMTSEEIAEALHVSKPTIARDLRVAQAWLATRLGASEPEISAP